MTQTMRDQAKELFLAGVQAADPVAAVSQTLAEEDFSNVTGKIYLIAIGKAAIKMADAARRVLPRVDKEVIVTNYENAENSKIKVFAAGHPVPDENGLKAGKAVRKLAKRAKETDLVVALISGGGSALVPAPSKGLTLADKAKVNELLLAAGIDITGMNLVRQQLSRLKGGGLARIASPARVLGLILSDVIGDDLRVVASGPTVAPIGTQKKARDLLKSAGIWKDCPAAVRSELSGSSMARKVNDHVENRLIGSNRISVQAMADAVPAALIAEKPLVGDVKSAAQEIVKNAQSGISLYGGETTVEVQGSGRGGRNQELALRVALLAEAEGWTGPWVFLSGGTDGRDGPTDAAGAIVDQGSLGRMRDAGVDVEALLANNDAYHALKASGDLLFTGATGTNVADLQVLIKE